MDIAELLVEMQRGPLQSWAEQLPTQIAKGMNIKRYGDLPRWQAALATLPQVSPSSIDLDTEQLEEYAPLFVEAAAGISARIGAAYPQHILDHWSDRAGRSPRH